MSRSLIKELGSIDPTWKSSTLRCSFWFSPLSAATCSSSSSILHRSTYQKEEKKEQKKRGIDKGPRACVNMRQGTHHGNGHARSSIHPSIHPECQREKKNPSEQMDGTNKASEMWAGRKDVFFSNLRREFRTGIDHKSKVRRPHRPVARRLFSFP